MCTSSRMQKTIIGTVLSLVCSVALANDCQVQISPATIDYGNLNPSLLRASASSPLSTTLNTRAMQLNIVCTAPQVFILSFNGAASGVQAYKLSDKGEFDLTLSNAVVDGKPALLGEVSNVGEDPVESSGSLLLKPNKYFVPLVGQRQSAGKSLSVKVDVGARLFVAALKLRDATNFEGQGSFDLQD